MSIELLRETINFESLLGEGNGQMMVGGDMILGDRSPEILNILHIDGKATVTETECMEDKVLVEGKMAFELLYSSHGTSGCVYKVTAVSNFSHSIHVPGAKANAMSRVHVRIDHINVDQVNSRKMKVNAIVNLEATLFERFAIDAAVDMKSSEVQVLKNLVKLDEYIGETSVQSIVKGHFDMSSSSVEINSLLKSEIFIYRKNIELGEGNVAVSACARVKLLYDNPEGELFQVEQDVAFSNELAVKEAHSGMRADVTFRIVDSYDEIKENEEGVKRIIDSDMVVEISCRIYGTREFENVVDAYSTLKRYEMVKECARSISYFSEGSESEGIRERLRLPESAKPAGRMKGILVKPVITETKAVDNKVILEGVLNCCIIYIAALPDNPLCSYEEELPFKMAAEVPGVKIDMSVEAEVNVCEMSFELVSDRNIDLKLMLVGDTRAYVKGVMDISSNAVETELPDSFKHMPSIVIYTVQPNDTPWKIAKKYNTTVEDIQLMNKLEEQDAFKQGMKLLIPKKKFMRI